MLRSMMKSKIHRATVTQAELNYEGSLTLDEALMEAAGIVLFEQLHVLNLNNGKRFETYAIRGERCSGVVCLNGPAARLGMVGDEVIIIAYAAYRDDKLAGYSPTIVHVDKSNCITSVVRDAETTPLPARK